MLVSRETALRQRPNPQRPVSGPISPFAPRVANAQWTQLSRRCPGQRRQQPVPRPEQRQSAAIRWNDTLNHREASRRVGASYSSSAIRGRTSERRALADTHGALRSPDVRLFISSKPGRTRSQRRTGWIAPKTAILVHLPHCHTSAHRRACSSRCALEAIEHARYGTHAPTATIAVHKQAHGRFT